MGVPKFFRFLSERYPKINELLTSDIFVPEIDNLYIDMNGIIHGMSHPGNSVGRRSDADIILDLVNFIDWIVSDIAKPLQILYLAIDGVAPRAKMNQQRSRRFRASQELEETLRQEQGPEFSYDNVFESNQITPGTEFLMKVRDHVLFFIRKRQNESKIWQRIKVIFSGPESPGEGEHKIISFIRHLRVRPDYSPNTRHCMYGQDADLIMLGLCTHEPHFILLREVIDFKTNSRSQSARSDQISMKQSERTKLQLLHISILREYIERELCDGVDKSKYEFERIVDDFVLITFLIGNDFLPHSPVLDIGEHAFDRLFSLYKEMLKGEIGYFTNSGEISDPQRFELFLSRIGDMEAEIFEIRRNEQKEFHRRTRSYQNDVLEPEIVIVPSEVEIESTELKIETLPQGELENSINPPISSGDQVIAQLSFTKIDYEEAKITQGDQVITQHEETKKAFYFEKFKISANDNSSRNQIIFSFVEGLLWCLKYYCCGCVSWGWFYPYNYAPMISDLKNINDIIKDISFDLGRPLQPFHQLMCCLPPGSAKFLPKLYQFLMTSPKSPVIEFYPTKFEIDQDGKRNPWEAIIILPFINITRVLNAIQQFCPDSILTTEEKQRNCFGPDLLLSYDPQINEIVTPPSTIFQPLNCCRSQVLTLGISIAPKNPFQPKLLNGFKSQVPGFPTLYSLPITSHKLQRIPINCFGSSSRYTTLVLKIEKYQFDNKELNMNDQNQDHEAEDNVQEKIAKLLTTFANKYLNQVIFVNWPFLLEARVNAVSCQYFELRGHDIQRRNFEETESREWKSGANTIQHLEKNGYKIPGSGGLKIDIVEYLVHVSILQGLKINETNGELTKCFGNDEISVPIQLCVFNDLRNDDMNFSDPRFAPQKQQSIDVRFPRGSQAIVTRGQYRGNIAIIEDHNFQNQTIHISVQLPLSQPSEVSALKKCKTTFFPSYEVVEIIGLRSDILGRITGSFFVDPGKKDIGLNFKTNGKYQMLGFTQFQPSEPFEWLEGDVHRVANTLDGNDDAFGQDYTPGNWTYSKQAIELVQQYMTNFPELFEKIKNLPTNIRTPKATQLFSGGTTKALAELSCVSKWLDSVLSQYHFIKIPTTTTMMSQDAIKLVEEMNTKWNTAAQTDPKSYFTVCKVNDVNPALLFSGHEKMNITVPIITKFGSSSYPGLGLRVINFAQQEIPFGLRGTIVGINYASGTIDVIFDESFPNGTTLEGLCSSKRGSIVRWSNVLPLTSRGQHDYIRNEDSPSKIKNEWNTTTNRTNNNTSNNNNNNFEEPIGNHYRYKEKKKKFTVPQLQTEKKLTSVVPISPPEISDILQKWEIDVSTMDQEGNIYLQKEEMILKSILTRYPSPQPTQQYSLEQQQQLFVSESSLLQLMQRSSGSLAPIQRTQQQQSLPVQPSPVISQVSSLDVLQKNSLIDPSLRPFALHRIQQQQQQQLQSPEILQPQQIRLPQQQQQQVFLPHLLHSQSQQQLLPPQLVSSQLMQPQRLHHQRHQSSPVQQSPSQYRELTNELSTNNVQNCFPKKTSFIFRHPIQFLKNQSNNDDNTK